MNWLGNRFLQLSGAVLGTAMIFSSGCGAGGGSKKDVASRLSHMDSEKMAEELTKRMTVKLDLDDAQQEKVEEINLRYAKEAKETVSSGGKGSSKLSKWKELQNQKDEELKQALTESQYNKYLVLKKEMRNRLRASAR